ncbi:hypothetical protein ACFL4T_07050 [candidate division KSB1 bacterium]
MKKLIIHSIFLFGILFIIACSQNKTVVKTALSADEIIERSYQAHGGDALTKWKTLQVKGEVYMFTGGEKPSRGEYLSYVQKPDKFRRDRNLTKYEPNPWDYTDIYNSGQGWTTINLIPNHHPVFGMIIKRMLDSWNGAANYRTNADSLILQQESTASYVLDGDSVSVPAYVIKAKIKNEETVLYFDKNSFYLIQEEFKVYSYQFKKVYLDFRKYGDVVFAGKRIEFSPGQASSRGIRYLNDEIIFDAPIDESKFNEFKPENR